VKINSTVTNILVLVSTLATVISAIIAVAVWLK